MSQRWSTEDIRRSGAYHEAAHAVVDVLEGHTVRYVSIETEGTDYQNICVTAVHYLHVPGLGRIPDPPHALGHAVSAIAGNMAMWREYGATYPKDSWEMIIEGCKEIEEESDDPSMLGGDTMQICEYCEAATLSEIVKIPPQDELPADSAPLSPRLSRTGKEVYEVALEDAEDWVNRYWPAITNVAEKLMEVGYLTGEEVEEIVFDSEPFQGETN